MSGKRVRQPKQKPQFKYDPVNQQMTAFGDDPDGHQKNANHRRMNSPKYH